MRLDALLGSVVVVAVVLVYAGLTAFPLLYVLMRWRSAGRGEPGLGTRAGIAYFLAVSSLTVVTCLAVLLYTWISEDDLESTRRTVVGIGLGAFVFWLLNLGLAARLGPSEHGQPVRRLFGGFGLLIGGLMLLGSLVFLGVALLKKGDTEEETRFGICFTGVWLVTFLVRFLLLDPDRERAS